MKTTNAYKTEHTVPYLTVIKKERFAKLRGITAFFFSGLVAPVGVDEIVNLSRKAV